jgi:hypothetical protein
MFGYRMGDHAGGEGAIGCASRRKLPLRLRQFPPDAGDDQRIRDWKPFGQQATGGQKIHFASPLGREVYGSRPPKDQFQVIQKAAYALEATGPGERGE